MEAPRFVVMAKKRILHFCGEECARKLTSSKIWFTLMWDGSQELAGKFLWFGCQPYDVTRVVTLEDLEKLQ
jgi:hypothetical protein